MIKRCKKKKEFVKKIKLKLCLIKKKEDYLINFIF